MNYKITSAVPDLTGYTAYTFEVSDILSEGLTLNMDSTDSNKPDVTIKVGGTEVSDWTVEAIKGSYGSDGKATESTDGTAIIGFRASTNLVGKNYAQGAIIEITYSAVVNEKAVSGVETNEATLKYSNNPNDNSSTDTETDKTEVYDASIAVLKYDGAGDTNKDNQQDQGETWKYLSGAEFVLYKRGEEAQTAPTSGDYDTVTKDGTTTYYPITYYKYTAPTTDPAQQAKVEWVADKSGAARLTTGTDGKLSNTELGLTSFAGLEDGTYYLLETAAPTGYNLLDAPVEIKIEKSTSDTGAIVVGSVEKPIANNAGTLLPSTGGMGTTMLYIIGAVLVVGAGVLLIVRRRMRVEK